MKRHPLLISAFSLVEVVLAIGIISIALVSIVGTIVESQIVQKLSNQLQQSSYASLIANVDTNYYFGYDGAPAEVTGAAFSVAVTTSTNVALPPAANCSSNLLLATLRVSRKTSPLFTNVFQIYIAKNGL